MPAGNKKDTAFGRWLNEISSNLKMMRFKMPNAAYSNRYFAQSGKTLKLILKTYCPQ